MSDPEPCPEPRWWRSCRAFGWKCRDAHLRTVAASIWKLAATLHSDAGPRLLDSCERERRPVAAALLVRPDGFVAWRSKGAPSSAASAATMLTGVLQRTLSRTAESASAG